MKLNLLKHKIQILTIFFIIVGFALIRNFEDDLFYDPLLVFFKGNFTEHALPELIEWKLYLNLFLRYLCNSLLSLFFIYTLFKNQEFLKLATILYIFFFVILILLFAAAIHLFSDRMMFLFYVRRFIIQPLFLLLFVPGFYFQQYDMKKSNS